MDYSDIPIVEIDGKPMTGKQVIEYCDKGIQDALFVIGNTLVSD